MICQSTGGGYGDVLERNPEAPPKPLPHYGPWGDDNTVIHATAWTTRGPARVAASMSQLPQIFPPNQNVLAIAAQQARMAERMARIAEMEQR
jgi:hypothetical protein